MRCIVSKGLSSETASFLHKLRISTRSASEADREFASVIADLSCLITEDASAMMRESGNVLVYARAIVEKRNDNIGSWEKNNILGESDK
jgi:hypothetical protein